MKQDARRSGTDEELQGSLPVELEAWALTGVIRAAKARRTLWGSTANLQHSFS